MKIKYDQEADILVLMLKDEPPQDAIEEPGGVKENNIKCYITTSKAFTNTQ